MGCGGGFFKSQEGSEQPNAVIDEPMPENHPIQENKEIVFNSGEEEKKHESKIITNGKDNSPNNNNNSKEEENKKIRIIN